MTLMDAVGRRRSHSKVLPTAPTHEELLPLVAAAASVADYGSLRPWRIIELRGDSRMRLGMAMSEAGGGGTDSIKVMQKPLRAELLLALVVCVQPSHKVTPWEQEVAASGVAHLLSLLLDDAGWGVMWRSGPLTRTEPVRQMHGLASNEQLLGWLYVGGIPVGGKSGEKARVDASQHLSAL